MALDNNPFVRYNSHTGAMSTYRSLLLVVVAVLLLGSIVASVLLWRAPISAEEEVTRVSYQIGDSFEQKAYGDPTAGTEQPNPVYFTKIIQSMTTSYTYDFLAQGPIGNVTEDVEISAVLESPGYWQKEVTLLPKTEEQGSFTIYFPLDTAQLLKLAADISNDIGVYASAKLTVKATVQTHVQTDTEELTLPFVQTVEVKAGGTTLEWGGNLNLSKKGYWEGLVYEHRGSFNYTIKLEPNILYGPITLNSAAPPDRHQELAASQSYTAAAVETVDVTLNHVLETNEPLSSVESDVEVTATLGKAGGSEQTFVLFPKSQRAGNFSVTFPVDVALFYGIIQDAPQETAGPPSAYTYNLGIKAEVHTTAQSEFGSIDEFVTPSLTATLDPNFLTWGAGNSTATKAGTILEAVTVFKPGRLAGGIVSTAAFVVLATLCLVMVRGHIQATRFGPSSAEAEAIKAKGRHKDIIVDVQSLPMAKGERVLPSPGSADGLVVSVGSLQELIKVADSLLKPVLHKVETNKHTYWVIDGLTRYEYISTLNSP